MQLLLVHLLLTAVWTHLALLVLLLLLLLLLQTTTTTTTHTTSQQFEFDYDCSSYAIAYCCGQFCCQQP
jgi:hypothetical protein